MTAPKAALGATAEEMTVTICAEFPFLHRCYNTDGRGCVAFPTCRHCGDVGRAGTDHTCPCPHRDEDCEAHANGDSSPGGAA